MKTENNKFARAEMLIRKPVSEVFQAFWIHRLLVNFGLQRIWKTRRKPKTEWTWEMYGFSLSVRTVVLQENKRL